MCPPPMHRVLPHDGLVEVVRRAMRRGGVTSSKEPLLAAMQSGPRTRLPRAKAWGDILYVLANKLQVGDVSVHPGAARYRRAAAAQKDTEKQAQCHRTSGVHTASRPSPWRPLGAWARTPMMCLLSDIGNLAVSPWRRPLHQEAVLLGRPPGTRCQSLQD
jgi:hypothetical protein